MSFNVTVDAYARFMGRFSEPLAPEFGRWAGVRPGDRALDVGCGPGALTAWLSETLGAGAVCAVDPSPPFVQACEERFPEVDVRPGRAEALPFDADSFDVVLAQLVVHFMSDPVAGLAEMGRVARPGGIVAACVWDHSGDRGPLSSFWKAVHDLDPETPGEASLVGAREGELAGIARRAGLDDVESGVVTVRVHCRDFDDWWEPFTFGVGPAGAYVAGLAPSAREALRAHYAGMLPVGPFDVVASAWAVRARA